MKACPKCQMKNDDSSPFCKRCGSPLAVSSFQDKREKVLGEEQKKRSWGWIAVVGGVIVTTVTIAYWLLQKESAFSDPRVSSQPKLEARVDYTGQKISMTDILAKVENGKITIPVETVLAKKIVRFEYTGNGVRVPLLSYVSQSGKLVTAVSMCEPCRSTRFHIEGKTLVCNACGTKWNLETLKGIEGGCLNYPPDLIPSAVEKGLIQIDEKVVTQWKPRV